MATFAPNDKLIASWSPATRETASYLSVTVLEVASDDPDPVTYKCQTNMGVTMVIPEKDLVRPVQ